MVFGVSDFVAVFNQTLEYAYPSVSIEGELANVRVSRGKWVYFDLKDEYSSVKCFGTIYQLPGPVEDGMRVRIVAAPRLHQLYGFSLNISQMMPVGEGSIKKAADLLLLKLEKEGLFDEARKRPLPYAPSRIALVTSPESAAYKDFLKILKARWSGVAIQLFDTQVQGEQGVIDVVSALERVSQLDPLPEVVIVTRGGGSADDLAVFSTEQVVRAVAASRVPTLVAIGHEIDVSLAELAADVRASTPSNAAEILVPDKKSVAKELISLQKDLADGVSRLVESEQQTLIYITNQLVDYMQAALASSIDRLKQDKNTLELLSPQATMKRGYAIVRSVGGNVVRTVAQATTEQRMSLEFADGTLDVEKV